jgi:hypothetical protein
VFIHISRRNLDHPVRKIFHQFEDNLLKFKVLAKGLQKIGLQRRKERDQAYNNSDSNCDSNYATSSSEETKLNSSDDKLLKPLRSLTKQRNSAAHEPRQRPQFQPHFSNQIGGGTLTQYAPQSRFYEETPDSEYRQSQRRIKVPNRPHSTHIDRDYCLRSYNT